MKNRIISLFIYLLPGLIYAQNNADDKYEIMSLTDMLNLFKDSIKTYQQVIMVSLPNGSLANTLNIDIESTSNIKSLIVYATMRFYFYICRITQLKFNAYETEISTNRY